ncbi:hypothetical protein [Methanobrevibacter sp. DSM 116169]|uniref:hypothetical protein n=1 Tax=Methanobrevibacter sp. DSM 116169 TaxID=3242727 RepID=UPI0038FC45A7
MIDKDDISDEIIDITNEILDKYNEKFEIDDVFISNTNTGYNFFVSLRVDNKNNIKPIINDLEDKLKKFGNITFKQRLVKSCCDIPHDYINFDIDYKLNVF